MFQKIFKKSKNLVKKRLKLSHYSSYLIDIENFKILNQKTKTFQNLRPKLEKKI